MTDDDAPSPSAHAAELHDISDDEACALVDACLGAPETWEPELVKWRLDHESQRDWKIEVGHWLNTAKVHGFADLLVVLSRKDLGAFLAGASMSDWRHVGAVVFLDYLRGVDHLLYTCTVLLNPGAEESVRCERAWFTRARVLWFDGERFYWQGGMPAPSVGVRDGTAIVDPWW
jgi:hypothetical protein